MTEARKRRLLWLISLVPGLLLLTTAVSTQTPRTVTKDCIQSAGVTRQVNGKTVGVTKCEIMEETELKNVSGVGYRRVEIVVDGCLEGYTAKDGPARHPELMQFTDVPEFSLAQEGNFGPYYHATSCYIGAMDKSGLTVFLPSEKKNWNGKLFMIFHGGSPYVPFGELVARKPGEFVALAGESDYAVLMIDKGYAVAYTRRSAHSSGEGDMGAIVDTGEELGGKDDKIHLGILRDWTELAQNFVESNFQSRPARTYWYGRSGGGAPGRLINYLPGLNKDSKGRKLFDGFIIDDAAGGWYMPTLFYKHKDIDKGVFSVEPDDKDHLIFDEARHAEMAPQFDVAHLGYTGNDFVEDSYPVIKRRNARLLVEKGLGDKTRHYEIRAVSHGDAGAIYPAKGWDQNMDLGGVFEALINDMERWVEAGVQPPPTRSDMPFLGDVNRDGIIENPAIELPEVGCPLGVYYEFPPGVSGSGRTGFAPFLKEPRPALNADTSKPPPGFDEAWLEPLNSKGRMVDMNGNGVRDTRESIAQAWERRWREGQKHGTLAPGEKLTQARYRACVAETAAELYKARLLSEPAFLHYMGMSAPDLPAEP